MQIKHILPIFALLYFFLTETVSAQVQIINQQASPLIISASAILVDDINPTTLEEIAAYGVGLTSNGQLVTGGEGVQFLIDYAANIEAYDLSDKNNAFEDKQNFHDYQIRLLSRFFIAKSWHFDAEVSLSQEIQRFGVGISQLRTDVLEADQLRHNNATLTMVYGNDLSSRFISLKVFANDDTYEQNNAYSTLFNMTQQGAELNVAYRQSSITSLLFRMSAVVDDYDSVTRDDSHLFRTLLGLKWQPSGKSTLEALAGMYWRNYSEQNSNSGLSWLINYSLEPTENWLIKINSARFSDVSNNEFTSDSIKQNIVFDINYQYSEQWKIGINGKIEKTEFNELEQTTELDEAQANLYVTFGLKKHSQVSLICGNTSQSTSNKAIDYQQSQARLIWQLNF